MALRAVFREIRRAAVRLDGRAAAVGTLETTDRLRQSLNLKAWLLPEPFSPEAIAYARGGSDAPWQRLVHYGTRRALRAQLEQDELLDDGLTLLRELNSLEHEMASSADFRRRVEVDGPQRNTSVLHAGSHAALAGVLDGATPDVVERQIEATLERVSSRALSIAAANADDDVDSAAANADDDAVDRFTTSQLLSAVNTALFWPSEMGLHALPPNTPLQDVNELLEQTRSALVHTAFEAKRGSPLALGLILSEVLYRCGGPQMPQPRLIALPRSSRPLAMFTSNGGLEGNSEQHATLVEALRSEGIEVVYGEAAAADAKDYDGAAAARASSSWQHRILVACVDDATGAPILLDPSANGARTRLECSPQLISRLRDSDPIWAANLQEHDETSGVIIEIGGEPQPAPWEVPASALLERSEVIGLLLKQLVDLFHAAGTPHAIKMHHRCAALLADLEAANNSKTSE